MHEAVALPAPSVLPSRASPVFSRMNGPTERIYAQPRSRAKLLPSCCGTYVFYDTCGDVLYIGKAINARSRVRSHLLNRQTGHFLPSWTSRIARIEVRPAASELEALLVEADLVARLRPAFNRQMRAWPRYCYLVRHDAMLGPFTVSTQACSWHPCFGPYRSRRQAVQIIEALFRLERMDADRRPLLDRFERLLTGRDDSLIVQLEQRLESHSRADGPELNEQMVRRMIAVLRKAHDRGTLLAAAAGLLNAMLVLPGHDGARTVTRISHDGLHLDRLEPKAESARAVLKGYHEMVQAAVSPPRLPKPIADILCVAAQYTRRYPKACRIIPPAETATLSTDDLLARVG